MKQISNNLIVEQLLEMESDISMKDIRNISTTFRKVFQLEADEEISDFEDGCLYLLDTENAIYDDRQYKIVNDLSDYQIRIGYRMSEDYEEEQNYGYDRDFYDSSYITSDADIESYNNHILNEYLDGDNFESYIEYSFFEICEKGELDTSICKLNDCRLCNLGLLIPCNELSEEQEQDDTDMVGWTIIENEDIPF